MSSNPTDPAAERDIDHAELVGLLQPFVDGELSPEEHEHVALRVASNPTYQAIVDEQQRVRAALRGLARESASSGLRARLVAELDEVDREHERERRRGWLTPIAGRLRAFGKGTLLMMPAAAAAAVLFLLARQGELEIGNSVAGGVLDGAPQVALHGKPGARAFPIDSTGASLPSGVEQVSGSVGDQAIHFRDAEGRLIVDRPRQLFHGQPSGTRQVFRGQTYHLGRDERGRARVEFVRDGIVHSLRVEQGHSPLAAIDADEPDFLRLLELGEALRSR
jgi:hypothetical protein